MAKKNPPTKTTSRSKKTVVKLSRPPVITVLGHVDHGKTTILDKIRNSNVQEQETGGITQHIGAYKTTYKNQQITFIDTPGHAAFAKMRQRGAKVTDLVILVIAAGDGVKPQRKESIRHIKDAGVPLIVAINKMDVPGANADMVKAQLVENDIKTEGFGGDVVCVETIASRGKGINELLDMVLLVSSLNELKGSASSKLKAVVIESKLEKKRGTVATLIVKSGTLKKGDSIFTSSTFGKARILLDETGKYLESVLPGEPVEVLGFKKAPLVGDLVTHTQETFANAGSKDKPEAKKAEKSIEKIDENDQKEEADEEEEEEKPRIKAIIKADTQGTLEAIKASVAEEVERVGSGVGEVTQSDVFLAQATGATILAFRVSATRSVKKLADLEKVEIKNYQAIFELLEDLEKQVLKILEPTIDEEVVGEAKIIATFDIKKTRIAGCRVTQGKLEKDGKIHLMRKGKITADATISSLKQGKKDIEIAKKGEECGVVLKPALDFKVSDTLQYYRTVETK